MAKTNKQPKPQNEKPIAQEFSERPDGKYNFWHKIPFIPGHTETEHNPVWVIRGVFKKLPKWAK